MDLLPGWHDCLAEAQEPPGTNRYWQPLRASSVPSDQQACKARGLGVQASQQEMYDVGLSGAWRGAAACTAGITASRAAGLLPWPRGSGAIVRSSCAAKVQLTSCLKAEALLPA